MRPGTLHPQPVVQPCGSSTLSPFTAPNPYYFLYKTQEDIKEFIFVKVLRGVYGADAKRVWSFRVRGTEKLEPPSKPKPCTRILTRPHAGTCVNNGHIACRS